MGLPCVTLFAESANLDLHILLERCEGSFLLLDLLLQAGGFVGGRTELARELSDAHLVALVAAIEVFDPLM